MKYKNRELINAFYDFVNSELPYSAGWVLEVWGGVVVVRFLDQPVSVIPHKRSAGSFGKADLYVEGLGSVQVKARKELGFLKWLDGADMLVVKQDRDKPYVVVELERFLRLVRGLTNHDRG